MAAFLSYLPNREQPTAAADRLSENLKSSFSESSPARELVDMLTPIAQAAGVSGTSLSIRGDASSVSKFSVGSCAGGGPAGAAAGAAANVPAIAGGAGGGFGALLLLGGAGFLALRRKKGADVEGTSKAVFNPLSSPTKRPLSSSPQDPTGIELSPAGKTKSGLKVKAASATQNPMRKNAEWKKVYDGDDVFYENTRTGEVSWTLPASASLASDPEVPTESSPPPAPTWTVVLDGDAEFYRFESGETSWVRPEGVQIPLWERVEDGDASWYRNSETGETSWVEPEAASSASGPDSDLWEMKSDGDASWFVNTVSQETSWELPAGARRKH